MPHQGIYLGAFEGDVLVGVLGHLWTGTMVPQAPNGSVAELALAAASRGGRPITGVVGPDDQVRELRRALGLTDAYVQLDSSQVLHALALERLAMPQGAVSGEVSLRALRHEDRDAVEPWYVRYEIEASGATDGPELRKAVHARMRQMVDEERGWWVMARDERIGLTGFNAVLPDAVELGGVYTPPAARNRGYGSCGVALALSSARDAGARRATLFTPAGNRAAQRMAARLGFQPVGEFRLLLFG